VNERERVLKLLEEKRITAEEAARLLDAMKRADSGGQANRFIKVRVFESGVDKAKVNVTMPIALVRWGMRMIPDSAKAKIEEHEIDLKVVSEALERGLTGKIVDVTDEKKGEHVEVWLE
jgi:hypothetical protein